VDLHRQEPGRHHVKTEIVYCSHKGNTRQVAEAIGEALRARGTAEVVDVETAAATIGADVDLLVVGGPTEAHGMTAEVRAYLEKLDPMTIQARAVAAFDTRVDWPRILSGSAADGIAKGLAAKGARVVGPQGSFLVTNEPALQPGEIERAREWATALANAVEPLTV
jgi:flavodoxin